MLTLCLSLIPIAASLSWIITKLAIRLGHAAGALDTAPIPGQIKMQRRAIPNTGGIGIFWGFALPLFAALLILLASGFDPAKLSFLPHGALDQLGEFRARIPLAGGLLICVSLIHALGLVDDRKPLGPLLKLIIMLALAFGASYLTNSRILTMLDVHVGGPWLSYLITVLWIVTLTNAMNFLDNMDGLSGGVGAITSASFAVVAAMHGHWFIAACFALLCGSLSGFLLHNFPPAKVFMGDGGSLVIGFLIAILSIRITYIDDASVGWYALLTPFAILAVPLYDFTSVTIVRLSKGKSPFVGDLNHFSHRIVRRGLSKRSAVLVIYGFAACTGLAGILMSHLREWQAILLAAQIMVMLIVVAIFEYAAATDPSSEGGTL